jgi:hypothetical protein
LVEAGERAASQALPELLALVKKCTIIATPPNPASPSITEPLPHPVPES